MMKKEKKEVLMKLLWKEDNKSPGRAEELPVSSTSQEEVKRRRESPLPMKKRVKADRRNSYCPQKTFQKKKNKKKKVKKSVLIIKVIKRPITKVQKNKFEII